MKHIACSVAIALILAACDRSARRTVEPGRSVLPVRIEDVLAWAKGSSHRIIDRKGIESRLIVLATDGSAREASICIPDASSFCPAPGEDPRIFFIVNNVLAVEHPGQQPLATPRPARWPSDGERPRLTKLLGVREVSHGIELLATGYFDAASASDELFFLQVSESSEIISIAAAATAPAPELRQRDAFYANFTGTRCRRDGRECLQFGGHKGRSYIDLEPTPGDAPRPLHEMDGEVIDATWSPGSTGDIMALVHCEEA